MKIVTALAALSLSFVMSACGASSDETSGLMSGAGKCQITPTCSQTHPKLGKTKGFSNARNKAITTFGNPLHRAQDVIVLEGKPVWITAKFSYGLTDADLKGEPVDVYLSQGCQQAPQKIATVKTTQDDEHETINNVKDSGGRIFLNLDTLGIRLPLGRHRVILVVPGDNSRVELYVDVISADRKIVVSDIDGTLTSSEMAAATEMINIQPRAHSGAAEALKALHNRGYHIFYLTARPEWLGAKTRAWLSAKGFPAGSLHTTQSLIGAQGSAAVAYKKEEMAFLRDSTGIVPSFAFGNKHSDVEAFGESGVDVNRSYYYKLEDDAGGGHNHSNYTQLAKEFRSLPSTCL